MDDEACTWVNSLEEAKWLSKRGIEEDTIVVTDF
jgi:hypothetical protein